MVAWDQLPFTSLSSELSLKLVQIICKLLPITSQICLLACKQSQSLLVVPQCSALLLSTRIVVSSKRAIIHGMQRQFGSQMEIEIASLGEDDVVLVGLKPLSSPSRNNNIRQISNGDRDLQIAESLPPFEIIR